LFRSTDGRLWVGTQQGLLRLHEGRVDGFRAIDGLSGDHVNAIFEDREGSVWVSTTDGLDRFREYPIATISRNQGISSSEAWSVQAPTDGNIWIGTPDGLNRWANGRVTVYRGRMALGQGRQRDKSELKGSVVVTEISNSGLVGTPQSLGLDDAGRFWASSNHGVFYFERGAFIRVAGIPGGNIYSIAADGQGSVWILHSTAGIFYRTPNAVVQHIPWSQFPQKTARAMLPDRKQGGLWLGFYEGGIAYLKDGKAVRSYGPADGLGDGRVTQLRVDSRDGVWAATEGGLSRINIKDGHIETLSSKNGLPCDVVHWSIEDNDHKVWVYMPCGLARIDRSEWNAWVDDPRHVVKSTIFDTSDGVRTVGVYGGYSPHVTKSADGRLWFSPRDGVSIIDPHHLPFNKLPPPVHIEQVTADGKNYDPANGLQLPPHVRDLTIDYTALSLVAPEKIHYRYKLEGQDPDWREVVNDREVQYSNLAPRHYTFRVMACNNSGVWNEAGAALEFSVLPVFYQTNSFRVFCVFGFLALLWGIYQLRLQQLQHQFNIALDARVNERTRIARELHDTLLQNFHGLMFQFQAASNLMLRKPDEAKQSLDDAIGETKKALAESREAIQDLRSEPIAKGNLAELLMLTSSELASSNGNEHSPVFELIEEGERRALSSTVSKDVCRIALEVMRNVYQHARAQKIEAEIRYDEFSFRLRIRDDGRGIDPKVLKEGGKLGHWGLRGVRERADRIGAHLDLWSEPGNGTEAQLFVPASIAYESFRDSYRAKLLRKVKQRAEHS
jgi:signal transduction histidine kinase